METPVISPKNPSMQAKLPAHIHLDLQAEASLHAQVKIKLRVKWQPGYDLKRGARDKYGQGNQAERLVDCFAYSNSEPTVNRVSSESRLCTPVCPPTFARCGSAAYREACFSSWRRGSPTLGSYQTQGATGYPPHTSLLQAGTAISTDRTGKSPPRPARPQRCFGIGDSPHRPARPGRRAGTGSSPDRPPSEEDGDVPPRLFQPPTLQRMG
jgi:hypothetical protein